MYVFQHFKKNHDINKNLCRLLVVMLILWFYMYTVIKIYDEKTRTPLNVFIIKFPDINDHMYNVL